VYGDDDHDDDHAQKYKSPGSTSRHCLSFCPFWLSGASILWGWNEARCFV